jgi:hypothetical protein
LTDFIFHLVYTSLTRQNIYSSSLSPNNQIYSRDCDKEYFYYESIQVKVNTTGYYSFRSYSSINACGLIYRNTFDPLNPLENLLDKDDDSGFDWQFRLNIPLNNDTKYVLVMTTYGVKETGIFSIVALGDNKVILERLSKYIFVLYNK